MDFPPLVSQNPGSAGQFLEQRCQFRQLAAIRAASPMRLTGNGSVLRPLQRCSWRAYSGFRPRFPSWRHSPYRSWHCSRRVERKQFFSGCFCRHFDVGQRQALMLSAKFDPPLPPRLIDENTPHRLGRDAEEMAAIGERLIADRSQIRFMHEHRRVQRLARFLPSHLRRRQSAQLIIDQRQQLLCRVRVALLDRNQHASDVAHGLVGLSELP